EDRNLRSTIRPQLAGAISQRYPHLDGAIGRITGAPEQRDLPLHFLARSISRLDAGCIAYFQFGCDCVSKRGFHDYLTDIGDTDKFCSRRRELSFVLKLICDDARN